MKHPLEFSRRLYYVENLDSGPNPDEPQYSEDPKLCDDEATANLVGSTSLYKESLHYPLFDIDRNSFTLLPSRSGNQHLYVNQAIKWTDYMLLLKAFQVSGLCDPAWAEACMREQVGVLRRPKSVPEPMQEVVGPSRGFGRNRI